MNKTVLQKCALEEEWQYIEHFILVPVFIFSTVFPFVMHMSLVKSCVLYFWCITGNDWLKHLHLIFSDPQISISIIWTLISSTQWVSGGEFICYISGYHGKITNVQFYPDDILMHIFIFVSLIFPKYMFVAKSCMQHFSNIRVAC